MKKRILLLALPFMCYGLIANAQEEISGKHFVDVQYKAAKNDFTAEFGLTGGLLNTDLKLNEGTQGLLRGRYFFHDNCAVRLGFNLGYDYVNENIYDASGTKRGTVVDKSNTLLINAGIEKHFKGTDRLSPYVGADLLFGYATQSNTQTNTNGLAYVPDYFNQSKGPGTTSFGVRALIGADYYIAKRLYLGAEAGLGFLSSIEGTTSVTTTMNNQTFSTTIPAAKNASSVSPSMITGVRIGFVF